MIPPLPTEIVHHIIKLSLPVLSFKSYGERYVLLLAYSLVNSTWRALAKKELYEELFVKDTDAAAAALSAEGALEAVKRVHLGPYQTWGDDVMLAEAMVAEVKLPKTVTRLRMASLTVKPDDLPHLSQLQVLHLRWCDLGRRGPRIRNVVAPSFAVVPSFRALSTLSLGDPYLFPTAFPTWTHWLNPTTLPCLSHLSLAFSETSEKIGQDEDFRRALSLLAPQLTAFTLAQGWSEFGTESTFPWINFTALSKLALFPSCWQSSILLRAALQGVQGSLLALRIGDCRELDEEEQMSVPWQQHVLGTLSKAFAEGTPSVRALQVLSVEHVQDEASAEVAEDVDKLRQVMKERGGSFEYRLGWEGQDELLDWERFLEPW